MGLPVLPIIAIASSVIGAGVSAIGAIQQGRAQSAAANYQAQVAQNNAIIARQNAEAAAKAGEAKAEATSLQSRAQLGAVMAAQAASGLDVNSGSAVDVRTTQREMGRLSQLTEQHNAALQQYGYQAQAAGFEAQSGLDRMQAASASRAGGISAAGSIIGGLGSAFSRFSWMQSNFGGFGDDAIGAGTGGLY